MTDNEQSRRNFMKTTAAAGAAAGFGGIGSAQLAAQQDDQEVAKTFKLLAMSKHWKAAGENLSGTNPTLNLEAGKKYRVLWKNVDGQSHNFTIFDANKNLVVHTPISDDEGDVHEVVFVATEEMIDYYCEVHYLKMRGDIRVEGETGRKTSAVKADYFDTGPEVGLDTVATGLNFPTTATTANEERNRLFVADQEGEIYTFDPTNDTDLAEAEPFLDITDRVLVGRPLHPPRGLLGMAFHPNFSENRNFYVHYSAPVKQFPKAMFDQPREKHTHVAVIAEYKANPDLQGAAPDSEKIILTAPMPGVTHNGGDLDFGPDNYLYIALGDGDFGGDTGDLFGHVPGGNGQDVENNLLGGILRIDVDNPEDDKPYGIPRDNPLVGSDGLDEYYAWGMRNPWGMSFDREGRLFSGDVGRSLAEEVNLVEKGGNYGWRIREGTLCFDPYSQGNPPQVCSSKGFDGGPLLDPIIAYPHAVTLSEEQEETFDEVQAQTQKTLPVGQAVVGGHIYEGDDLSEKLGGKYVFGDYSYSPVVGSGKLLVGTEPEGGAEIPEAKPESRPPKSAPWQAQKLQVPEQQGALDFFVVSFGRGEDNEIYVCTSATFRRDANDGAVHKLVPPEQHDLAQRAVVSGEEVPRQVAGPEEGNETAGNETAGNETVGNETVGNETETETEVEVETETETETTGNETAGNETAGNETAGNETAGNETS